MAQNKDPHVGIAGTIGGTTIVMVALIVIFAGGMSWISIPVVAFMTIMGIVLGAFAAKKK